MREPDGPLDYASALRIGDLPPWPTRDAAIAAVNAGKARRVWLGRSEDGQVALVLSDPQGRPRLTLGVGDDGTPRVELRDAGGRVTRTLR